MAPDHLSFAGELDAALLAPALQGHGWVLVLDPAGDLVVQAGANLPGLTGRPLPDLLGRPLAAVLGAEAADAIAQAIAASRGDGSQGHAFGPVTLPGKAGAGPLCAHGHRTDGGLLLEVEPATGGAEAQAFLSGFGAAIRRYRAATDMPALARTLARDLRRLTGFDRALVARVENGASLLLAADGPDAPPAGTRQVVPDPTRILLELNRVRLVADLAAPPVPLVPALNSLTGRPPDLSRAALRSAAPGLARQASPGVRSILAVSLMRNGTLWGVVWCESARPRHLPPTLRSLCEGLGEIAAAQVAMLEDKEQAARRVAAADALARIAADLRGAEDLAGVLAARRAELLTLFRPDGMLVSLDGGLHRHGFMPPATRWLPLLDQAGPGDGVSQGCDGSLAALRVEVSAGGSVVLVRRGAQPWAAAELEAAQALHRLLAERHAGLYRAKAEHALFRLANFDAVTDLPNRAALLAEAQRALQSGRPAAMLVVSLDRFRALKGTLGEARADQLLAEVARRLAGCLGPGDRLARTDTGAFAVLLCGERAAPGPDGGAEALALAVREGLRPPFPLGDRETHVTASLGLVHAAPGQADAAGLLRDAEIAAAEAEAKGGGARAFDAAMRERLTERYDLYERLRHGIYFGDAIRPVFQPIVDLGDGRLVGFEALARWTDPEKGDVPPGTFIQAAEETGLVVPLGNQILVQACRQVVRWNQGRSGPPLTVSVNLSAYQLDPDRLDLVRWVSGVLAITGADPSWLRLELTESGLVTHAGTAITVLQGLRDLGVGLSIDDFGTGYSSLAYLQRLPIDAIKIDRSFVAGLDDGAKGLALVRTIVQLARTMGLGVVAEGVETGRHLDVLQSLGCGHGQGYLFARPLEAAAAARLALDGATWDGTAWG